jgi:E3 UFM1-protein ligase 1
MQTEDAVMDPSYSLTKEDAFQLVKLMIERRYFHDNDKGSTNGSTKCHLIFTTDGKGYRTRDNLMLQWHEILQSNKGRISRLLVSETLHVTISNLNMNQFSNQYPEDTILLVEEDFILIPLYWETIMPTIIQSVVDHDGCQPISDLAKFLALPTWILLQYFPLDTINTFPTEHVSNTSSRSSSSCLISSSNQKVSLFLYHISSFSPCIVTDGWIEQEISRLHDVCLACDAPTPLSVLELDPTRHGAIMLDHGEIHGHLYVPTKYTIEQRRQQMELWKAQGFIFVPTTNSISWEALRSSIIAQNVRSEC